VFSASLTSLCVASLAHKLSAVLCFFEPDPAAVRLKLISPLLQAAPERVFFLTHVPGVRWTLLEAPLRHPFLLDALRSQLRACRELRGLPAAIEADSSFQFPGNIIDDQVR
jgi:hypothetical protein